MNDTTVIEVTDKEWEKIVENAKKPVAVMFYSPTCAYCHQIDPYFAEYADDFKEKVVFVKLNIVNNQFVVSRYGVMATPTFKFFCEGRPVQELVGAVFPPLLKKTVEDVLKNGDHCVKHSSEIDYEMSAYA